MSIMKDINRKIVESFFVTCPKSGRIRRVKDLKFWQYAVFPVVGLLSIIWFLVRVVPKPARAAYPCQRIAAGVGGSFLAYVIGIMAGLKLLQVFKRNYYKKILLPLLCVCLPFAGILTFMSFASSLEKTDFPNAPMGTAKGIPGKEGWVAWSHDKDCVCWNGKDHWYYEQYTSQDKVDEMLSRVLKSISGGRTINEAIDRIFKHNNMTRGRGDVGYTPGESIAMKINMNGYPFDDHVDANPRAVLSVVKALVNYGVLESDIILYEAARNKSVGTKGIRDIVKAAYPGITLKAGEARPGVDDASVTRVQKIVYSKEIDRRAGQIPNCVVDATYLINFALLKKHTLGTIQGVGVTLTFKNHFGTVNQPRYLHETARAGKDVYSPMIELNGCRDIGPKTILFLLDGTFSGYSHNSEPYKWSHVSDFLKDGKPWYPASLFASLDQVAIDSVGVDFLDAEFDVLAYSDNYLHEAALADHPPSGAHYTDSYGNKLQSMGVHEHWNNPVDKQYSRNLETGNGIYLDCVGPDNSNTAVHPASTRQLKP